MTEELFTDARILKTKKNTRKALITLLKTKRFDDISVKDICNEANVSRGTFYLHYKDKYDLVHQYQQEIIKTGSKKVHEFLNSDRHLFFYHMLNFWNNEAELLLLLISKNGSTEIQNQVKSMLQINAEKNILPSVKTINLSEREQHYFVIFLSNAIFGIIQEWVDNGKPETTEELSTIINKITPDSLLG